MIWVGWRQQRTETVVAAALLALLAPGLIGLLFAAPLVHQLEQGTHRLDWTQSITRGRWIAGKLGLAALAAVAGAAAAKVHGPWGPAALLPLPGPGANSGL